ncbi:MAG: hypothetical protein MI924_08865 [Chloroflexales bacterium]|nr:hypothetical protein [Chloroflexales bacterium]
MAPGSASGRMDGMARKPLTVGFHEAGFAATLNGENRQPFWFQLSAEERQQVGSPWGPHNPQALNRYSYVLNNPLRWTDPSGHAPCCIYSPFVGIRAALNWFVSWVTSKYQAQRAQEVFNAGGWVGYQGADGVLRKIRSTVKEGPPSLLRNARSLTKNQRETANDLVERFLNGNANPGIGTQTLTGTDVFYLRARDGTRVFMRKVGDDAYEIVGYANKHNEADVIKTLLRLYSR